MRPAHLYPPALPIALLLALTACAQPHVVVQEVKVPVVVPCPQPQLPPRPTLASRLLTPETPADQVWKAVLSDLAALMGYADVLEALWKAHEKPKEPAR